MYSYIKSSTQMQVDEVCVLPLEFDSENEGLYMKEIKVYRHK